jgi:hypothetical protein
MMSLEAIRSVNEKASRKSKAEMARDAAIEALLARCKTTYDTSGHQEAWRNALAEELNEVIGRVEYVLGCGGEAGFENIPGKVRTGK